MSCGRWDKEITPRLSLSFNLQARGAFCGHLEPCQAFAAIGPNPIGPLVSKTEANTNSLPAPLLFGHLKNQKRRIGCPAGPALSGMRRVGPARATVPRRRGRPPRSGGLCHQGGAASDLHLPNRRNGTGATCALGCTRLPTSSAAVCHAQRGMRLCTKAGLAQR